MISDMKTPIALAQGQLDAYNKRDLETFLTFFSEAVEVYDFPNTPRMSGMSDFKKTYEKLFRDSPELHCKLVGRISVGNIVMDQEEVSGINGKPIVRVIAIYEIENDLITKVRFVR
ncbi:MAG: nuclear transport factor 2 family protein [Bdellovibrionales bacterium]|nr:nuclear transport factor 2 family protein [Bdellovibrionales bacterium]